MNNAMFDEVLDHITFSVIPWLEQKNDITDVQVMDCQPAQRNMLKAWEDNNACKLPSDLEQFYLTSNGLLIQWSMQLQGNLIQIGVIEVNPIESLNRVSLRLNKSDHVTLEDIEIPENNIGLKKPRFDDKCFELSSDGKHGKVCLVYDNGDANVWFLDRALQWHHLAKTFQQYFRMLISNAGIKGWQCMYTDIGLTPESQQWFSYFFPQRLLDATNSNSKERLPATTRNDKNHENTRNKIDFTTLFKQKSSDKRKAEQARQKHEQQAGKSKGNTTNRSVAKNSKSEATKVRR